MQFVKVSDRVFTTEELIGATVIFGDRSLIVSNDTIKSQNGIITNGNFLVCSTPTTIFEITIPETGTYFMKMGEEFASSLSKPDSTTTVKIPAELTTVVGGYDEAERTSVIFDGTVKASDFTERSVSGVSHYFAPIALTEDLVKGATVSGTINGVQVSGTVGAGHVVLYAIAKVLPYQSSGGSLKVAEIGGDAGNYQIALGKQPESDLTIHLTQALPAHAVTIPEEYLELTETNAAISAAMSAASTAQSAASTAQSAASRAQATADTAKATADTAKATADTAKATADTAKATAKNAVHGSITGDSAYYSLEPGVTDDSIHSVHTYIGWSGGSCLGIIVKDKTYPSVTFTPPAYLNHQADFAFARATNAYPHPQITEIGGIVMYSTTSGSTKKFRITVDDTGTIKATEVTNN